MHKYDPVIVAHRGIHRFNPENSLSAFLLAWNNGISWVECDLWPSADGTIVIMHDDTLDRTTVATGLVGDRRWEELANIPLRDPDGKPSGSDRVPNLRELMTLAAERLAGGPPGLLVEVKPPDAPRFVKDAIDLLKPYRGPWTIQSFDEENLIHALAHDTATPVAFLVEDRPALDRGIANGWKNINADHQLLDGPTVRRMQDAGVTVGAWTVNEEADLRRVMDLGVQWIITDEPHRARKLLRQR